MTEAPVAALFVEPRGTYAGVPGEQGRYGHPARKATWLYAHGTASLPDLLWGRAPAGTALVSWCGNHVPQDETRPRVGKSEAARTPPAFRDALLALARSVPR